MDSVRFGRALGIGARLAAKTAARTLVSAADAATSPNPTPISRPTPTASQPAATTQRPQTQQAPTQRAAQPTTHTPSQTARTAVTDTGRGVARGTRQFGKAVWGPVTRLSGVLWLELTGVFFGLFALSAGIAAWKLRENLRLTATNSEAHTHLLLALGVAIVFGYFCISSFARANRRGRRP